MKYPSVIWEENNYRIVVNYSKAQENNEYGNKYVRLLSIETYKKLNAMSDKIWEPYNGDSFEELAYLLCISLASSYGCPEYFYMEGEQYNEWQSKEKPYDYSKRKVIEPAPLTEEENEILKTLNPEEDY